ncbi:MAG: glycosyltransferase family 4 protein [Syntrophobacteraceae bacterium]
MRSDSRPRICFFGATRYGFPLPTGVKKKFKALEKIANVRVVGVATDARPRRFTEGARFILSPAVAWRALRHLWFSVCGGWALLRILLRGEVDVIVAQSPYGGAVAAFARALAARTGGRRTALVVESHGDFEKYLFLRRLVRLAGLHRAVMQAAARFALSRADAIRAVSEATLRQLRRYAPVTPSFVFPAWTDMEIFAKAWDGPTTAETKYILYCGLVARAKGVHHLIRAFARITDDFPDVRLVVVGKWDSPEYEGALKRMATAAGLAGRIAFTGRLPQEEVPAWMAGARAFVLPSYSEGMPRVLLEAMAAGAPVIASNVGGVPELIEDGETGFLVPPGDEALLAERMRWVLEHAEEAAEMAERARTFVMERYSVESYVRGYDGVFREALRIVRRDVRAA